MPDKPPFFTPKLDPMDLWKNPLTDKFNPDNPFNLWIWPISNPNNDPQEPAEGAASQEPGENKAGNLQADNDSAIADQWVATQMADVKNKLNKIRNMLTRNPNYSVYIEFAMNSLLVCTATSTSMNNLIMSLEVNNNGSGYANEFTLQIAWAPSVNDNCNWLEEKMLGGSYNGQNFSSMYCRLKYGYATDTGLQTRSFMGIVTDYTTDIQDSMIIYTITGYSSIIALNESKDPISIEMTEEEELSGIRPTEAVKRIVQKYLQGEGTATASDSEGNSVTITRCPVNKDIKYDIKFLGDCYRKDNLTVLTTQLDKNISQAISDILNKAVDERQANESEQEDKNISNLNRSYYSWFMDDTATKNTETNEEFTGTIYVYRLTAEQRKNANATIVFNWMAPGNSSYDWFVKTFRPEYKGNVLLSIASDILNPKVVSPSGSSGGSKDGDDGEGSTETPDIPETGEMQKAFNGSYYLDNKGKLCTTQKSISPPIGGTAAAANSSIEQERSTWLTDVQYPYKATLTTLGVPTTIPITGIIEVIPIIYTTPHHSKGKYLITATKDILNSSIGFETTWELMKMDTEIEGKNTNINSGNSNGGGEGADGNDGDGDGDGGTKAWDQNGNGISDIYSGS